jgi:hypothetical protein
LGKVAPEFPRGAKEFWLPGMFEKAVFARGGLDIIEFFQRHPVTKWRPCVRRAVAVAALALGLAACSALPGAVPQGPCPRVSILSDASSVTQFKSGLAQDLIDIEYEAEIVQVAPKCSYDRDGRITTVTTLSLIATRGPAAHSHDANFIFFVAVIDQNQRVLARERFESMLQFARSQRRAGVEEEIEGVIPLAAGLSGANYEILVGFELSQEQLDFNRTRRRR